MVVRSNERVDEWLKCVMAVYIGEGFDYFNFNLICLEKEKGEKKMMGLLGGFARINNNEITVLVNDADKGSEIDPQEAQQTLEIAEANLNKAEGKRQTSEANLALRRARTRVEAINVIS